MSEKNQLETFIETQGLDILQTNLIGEPTLVLAHSAQKVFDLEQFQDKPRRIRGVGEFGDLGGIIAYTNDFANEESRAFIKDDEIKVIFDYHMPQEPRFCEHRAIFNLHTSARWLIWHSINNQWIPQKKFADFLDSGVDEISYPSQNVILDMVKNFRATTSYEFDNEKTAYGGEVLSYRKVTKTGTSITQAVEIPERIKIVLQPFDKISSINKHPELAPEDRITAFEFDTILKWYYDENQHEIYFKIQILNIEQAFEETLAKIKAVFQKLTKVTSYIC